MALAQEKVHRDMSFSKTSGNPDLKSCIILRATIGYNSVFPSEFREEVCFMKSCRFFSITFTALSDSVDKEEP